jgi:hypothetical protein
MTNLEALQSTIAGYPLTVNTFAKALTDRGITSTDTYTGSGQAFELAQADCYVVLATGANISEGQYSVSVNDRKSLLELANSIYRKWGYPIVGATAPKVKAVNPW